MKRLNRNKADQVIWNVRMWSVLGWYISYSKDGGTSWHLSNRYYKDEESLIKVYPNSISLAKAAVSGNRAPDNDKPSCGSAQINTKIVPSMYCPDKEVTTLTCHIGVNDQKIHEVIVVWADGSKTILEVK